MKKIIILIVIALLGFGIYKGVNWYIEDKNAWKVEIINDYINVREDHNLYVNKLGQVKKGEKYRVLEIYLEDSRYVWYKIEFENNKYGWISSGRNNPYVNEVNNPEGEGNKDYFVDYKKPVIKYFENVYYVSDINSISYGHLTIEDDSEYEITNNVYYEEDPIDSDIPQYWIEYIVTDAAGNTNSIVQKIVFEVNPGSEEVLDFSILEDKRN